VRSIAITALGVASALGCGRDHQREVAPAAVVTPRLTSSVPAACALTAIPWRFPAPARVVAFGDVHGDLAAAQDVLHAAGAVDEHGAWVGGPLWVVQTGDVLDRGGDEQAIIDWFERLESQAAAAGGKFIWLLGNHELMNAAGDFRYVTAAGFRDFEDAPGVALEQAAGAPPEVRARVAAFAPRGPYARILAGQNLAVVIGDTVFVHGGIGSGHGADLADDSLRARCWLSGAGEPPRALTDNTGVVWDRSFAQSEVDCAALSRSLDELGVTRMVVGHTVQPDGINAACDGAVWRIDVGLAALYGGPHQALELTSAGPRVITAPRR
jgi:Calcineurin-like phosphoesterase